MSPWQHLSDNMEGSYLRFIDAMEHAPEFQESLLQKILRENSDTEFGRKYDFSSILNVEDYRSRVPISSYEDRRSDIERMAAGHKGILVGSDVEVFEETSGSSSKPKLVPYTEPSLSAYRGAVFPWLYDLISTRPNIASGRCYWSISPVAREQKFTLSGMPIGLASDAAYFGDELQASLLSLSAVPYQLAGVPDIDVWRFLTVRYLLEAHDLSVISIWSPTFLLSLLQTLTENPTKFVDAVAHGEVGQDLGDLSGILDLRFQPSRSRANDIKEALDDSTINTKLIWPILDTISCWTDASSRSFAQELEMLFPHARIQGKGLLATEGPVSVPLSEYPFPVLAINSSFFEFMDSTGTPRLMDDLLDGRTYRLITTTPGGLYRYDTGDNVEVMGWAKQAPMLKFVGRGSRASDLVGEKITEDAIAPNLPSSRGFAMVAPCLRPSPHYTLFLDAERFDTDAGDKAASDLETALRNNPHYSYARDLNQLGPMDCKLVGNPVRTFEQYALENDQRLGDIKIPALHTDTDWDTRFERLTLRAAE